MNGNVYYNVGIGIEFTKLLGVHFLGVELAGNQQKKEIERLELLLDRIKKTKKFN